MSERRAASALKLQQQHRRLLVIGAAVAVILVGLGVFSRLQAQVALRQQTERNAITAVTTTKPEAGPAGQELVLPGNTQAYSEAPIFARTSGYLKRWLVDIGARVKQGQLLAEIETPEVDQQLLQAKADLATAQANYALAKSSAERWKALLESDSVSRQEVDERSGDAAAKKALVDSARANVERLRELQGFQRVTAPFSGVITARNTDIGALIGSNDSRPLFSIAATQTLRVYVRAPQNYASSVQRGLEADLFFAEHPGQAFAGKVMRTADALDPASRTLLVEIAVDNSKNELLAGSYTEVHMKLPVRNALRVPVNTLIFRADGLMLATVVDNKVVMKPVKLGRDFGMEVEVVSGLGADDNVVLNPPDSIADGQTVRATAAPAESQKPNDEAAKARAQHSPEKAARR